MKFQAYLIRALTFPLKFLPFKAIHMLGKALGTLLFHLIPHFKKRALSNLALAKNLKLSNQEIKKIAKGSFQSLCITCLEYAKLSSVKTVKNLVRCENPEVAKKLSDSGQGIVFFCAHQANWELLYLEAITRMPGIAIGRPIKNEALYSWITSIRERFGGRLVTSKNAIKESLRALKKGEFVGLIGDQGMPESGFEYPFFGRRSYTTPVPALLCYKTNSPMIVATIKRERGKYLIHYSDPIWPDQKEPLEKQVSKLMSFGLKKLEENIAKYPDQWLWQHNRWKQETARIVYYKYRYDSILIIVDHEEDIKHLATFKEIYPKAFLTILAPKSMREKIHQEDVIYFEKSPLVKDYRFKLIFDLTNTKAVKKHYTSLAAFNVISKNTLIQHDPNLSKALKKVLCRAP